MNGYIVKLLNCYTVVFLLLFLIFAPQAVRAQGGLIPTPGQSCNRITDTKARAECNQAICPKEKICAAGKCARMNEKGQPTDEAATLPCNYTIEDLVESGLRLVNFIFGIAGSLTLVFLVYGGYTMFTSLGNPEEIKKGRSMMTGAFIGLVLILSAALFIKFATSLVLPPKVSVSPGLEIPVGSTCTTKKEQEQCGDFMACDQGVCKTKCEKDKGAQGYLCMALGCLKDQDCGKDQNCFGVQGGGGYCVTPQEATTPYLQCEKNLCPGSATNQCCRVK